jgi:RNA polymerase sigma factor (sigma-70 family)
MEACLNAEDQVVKEEITPRENLYEAIEEHLERLKSGVQVLVARSGTAEGSQAINDVADEILAMALETAIQIADRFDPSLNAYSWLLTIASNKLKDYRKKVAREYRHADLIGNMPDPQPQDQSKSEPLWNELAEDEKLERMLSKKTGRSRLEDQLFSLEELLSLVNENDRTVLRLAYISEMSGQELAAVLNITEAAALMRLSRARSRLYDAYYKSEKSAREG